PGSPFRLLASGEHAWETPLFLLDWLRGLELGYGIAAKEHEERKKTNRRWTQIHADFALSFDHDPRRGIGLPLPASLALWW
ncbi:MAG TPA: hypothetical protein VF020_11230, partial [Chthoniobacterales bacterium]